MCFPETIFTCNWFLYYWIMIVINYLLRRIFYVKQTLFYISTPMFCFYLVSRKYGTFLRKWILHKSLPCLMKVKIFLRIGIIVSQSIHIINCTEWILVSCWWILQECDSLTGMICWSPYWPNIKLKSFGVIKI